MAWSENMLKWVMRCYPPLFFQRIWVMSFHTGFRGVKVKINKSLLNINPNGSIFGGTIFAAADPFYPVLFSRLLYKKDYPALKIWSKSSCINFLKLALSDLFFEIILNDEDIIHCKASLLTTGKFERSFPVEIYNKSGEVCVSIVNKVYLRNLNFKN